MRRQKRSAPLLLATVVGSGVMAQRMCGGNDGLALLANAIATGATLYVLILGLGRFRESFSIRSSR